MQHDYFCVLEQENVWQDVHNLAAQQQHQGGVYRVHALREGAPSQWNPAYAAPVMRLLGADSLGRLYVGQARDFTDRFITLRKSLHPDYRSRGGHGFGQAYHGSPAIQAKYPRLCFTLRFAADPKAAEAEELRAYREEFGELPPFNAMC